MAEYRVNLVVDDHNETMVRELVEDGLGAFLVRIDTVEAVTAPHNPNQLWLGEATAESFTPRPDALH